MVRRLFFKAGRTGQLEIFQDALKVVEAMGKNPIDFIVFNADPEKRNLIILCLLNAHDKLLKKILDMEVNMDTKSVALTLIILKTTYDEFPAMILAIGSYPFGETYRKRVEDTLDFLLDVIVKNDASWCINT